MQPRSFSRRSRLAVQGLVILLLAGAIAWLAFTPARAATRLYAKQDGVTSGTCESWQSACSLAYAIEVAASGDEIWAAAGIHRPTTSSTNARVATFQLKDGVEIYGGFAMTETVREERNFAVNLTVLSGDLDYNDTNDSVCLPAAQGDNAYHVVTANGATTAAVLDGFTITGGYAKNALAWQLHGGGIYNEGGSPTLNNLVVQCNVADDGIDDNLAGGLGGGMYNENGSPVLTKVTFENNVSELGGGMYNIDSQLTLITTTVQSNNAHSGGGIANERSSLTMNGGLISANVAGDGSGGGIINDSTSSVTLTDVNFIYNDASGNGGAISSFGGSVSLTNVTIWANRVGGHGGGIYSRETNTTLTNVNIEDNQANSGAGMSTYESDLTMTAVTINGNAASHSGGGIYLRGGNITITEAVFNNNIATYGGGMRADNTSYLALAGVIFNGNSAASSGGGMDSSNSEITLTNTTFNNNHAQTGGGMHNDSCTIDLGTVTFHHNTSKDYTYFNGQGGGIFNHSSVLTMNMVNFSENEADYGGGIYNTNDSTLTLTNATFYNNQAIDGGAILNVYGSLTVDMGNFDNNSNDPSNGHGGALYNRGAELAFTSTTFSNNTSNLGGAIYNEGSQPAALTNVTFISNTAQSGGGLYNTGTLTTTLINVTFGGNFAQDGGSMYNANSPMVHNTIFVRGAGGNNCSGAAPAEGSSANLSDDETCGGATVSANIKLGIFGSYGGNTLTIPLLPGSAALDSGNNTYCPATDQRGQPRPYPAGGICDVGAFESQGFSMSFIYLPVVKR